MKKLCMFFLFTLVFLSLSQVTYSSQDTSYLERLDNEFRRCVHVIMNPQSSIEQIEEAKSDIEGLSISGNLCSFNFLWDLRQGISVESENKAKAEFLRDFLVNDLPLISIINVSNKILEYQKVFPLFCTILQGLIDDDPEKEIINRNLESIQNRKSYYQ